ncbi:MAG: TonB-dependent receptor [Saprospiraceae bacterium]|nr:TonB-dependent receptor [Saprospiraceae bacterium]
MRLTVILLLLAQVLQAQHAISGTVKDKKGETVPFANVYLKEVFDGNSTDENGIFTFNTTSEGTMILAVSCLGYANYEQVVEINGPLQLEIVLEKGSNQLAEVVISAGAFEASDEKKITMLKPLDIVTNAGASGDVYGALQTLPGVSQVNDETGIFVRGGEAYETQTIIDGALVAKPFFGDTPDIPSRGRFNPFLFKGTLFSTGGYSAEYGRALSSVLLLNTYDIPKDSEYSLSLNAAGIGASRVKVWNDRTAFLFSGSYTNLQPLFSLIPQNRDWLKAPTGAGTAMGFRHRYENGAMLKSYFQYQHGSIGVAFPNANTPETNSAFRGDNDNVFWNTAYKGFLGQNWSLKAVIGLNYDDDGNTLDESAFGSEEWAIQSRFTLSREWGAVLWKTGAEWVESKGDYYFNELGSKLSDTYTAVFSELDWKIQSKLAARIGVRGEHSQLLEAGNLAPRLSLAYKTGPKSQVSFAYGQFFQQPEPMFLWERDPLNFEQAAHYIFNYQWITDDQTFRIELYQKDYDQLVRRQGLEYNNSGFGHAKGIDFFWRDKALLPGLDYWLSYSFLDAERLYRDFPIAATPTFTTKHTLNVVVNYRTNVRTRLGLSYTFASGRPYYNPNNPEFLSDRTKPYHNLNLNASYLTSISGNFTVLYISFRNPFQFEQVFGYTYSDDGEHRVARLPASDWSIFAGVSISFEDR